MILLGPRIIAIAVLVLTSAGCTDPEAATGAGAGSVLLLAAASTTDAVGEIGAAFEKESGTTVKISTGGSNALANQIMAGVPGEVFLSANEKWAAAIVAEGLAQETRPLLSNRLVIVTPRGNPARITAPADLLTDRLRHLVLAGEKTPAGMYAEQALRHAGAYDRLVADGRIARGRDVRLTLGFVETYEAEAGIVYFTDARASDRVEVVFTFPAKAHDPIVYPLVLLKSSGNPDGGRRLFDYLSSGPALDVFRRHGFLAAPDGR